MLLQKEKKKRRNKLSIRNVLKKEIIYERRNRSLSFRTNLFFFPPKKRCELSVKASFCISGWRRASLAVETAFVLPLFFMGILTMICFMDIYKVQTEHLSQLCTKAKQAGMYAYLTGESGAEDITLPDIYSYEPFGGLVPLPKVVIYNHVKVHAWTGRTFEGDSGNESIPEKMVYITESGSVYHKDSGCSYLNVSLKQIPGTSVLAANNQYGEHYTACETCSRNQKPAGVVFVTEQGNHYHNLETCSGLKRTVRMVKETETSGMKCCSRCG